MVTFFPILVWLAAIAAAGIALWFGRPPYSRARIQIQALRYLYVFPLGVMGIWIFLSYLMFPDSSADAIGWAPSPFQYEVAVCNLGLGVAAIYAAFSTRQAKFAVALAVACYLIGAGLGHISDLRNGDPYAPGNGGPILYSDFLAPILAFVLLWLTGKDEAAVTARAEDAPAASPPARPQLPPPTPSLPAPQPQVLQVRPRRHPGQGPKRQVPPAPQPMPLPTPQPAQRPSQDFAPQDFNPQEFTPAPQPSQPRGYRPEPEPEPLYEPLPEEEPMDGGMSLEDQLQYELERELERARQEMRDSMRDSLNRGGKGPPRR